MILEVQIRSFGALARDARWRTHIKFYILTKYKGA